MARLPDEVRKMMMDAIAQMAEAEGNTALKDTIAAVNSADEIRNILFAILPNPGACLAGDIPSEAAADVKEYLELVASGIKTFVEAHVKKYGEDVLDKEFVQRLGE